MNGNPFYVHPGGDMTQGLAALGQTFGQIGEQRREDEERQRVEDASLATVEKLAWTKAAAISVFKSGDDNLKAAFILENPELGKVLEAQFKFRDEQTKENYITSGYSALHNPDKIPELVEARQNMLRAQGVGVDDSKETDGFMAQYKADPEAAMEDLKNDLIVLDPERWKKYAEATGRDTETGAVTVGAQEILEDGTTIQSLKGGGTVVYDPEGNKLTGKDRRVAIQVGRAEKVSNLRKAAGGKREAALEADLDLRDKVEAKIISAKDAAKASGEAFDKVEKIYQNIENLNEAIRLVEEEGAEIGAISARLPSIRSAAVKLDNLQGRLGLDVIGNTTFGALSEAELKFALAVALPQKDEDLVGWAKRKVAAQEKLADYLEGAAIYLGTPGNTKVGWLEMQRNKVGNKYGRTQQAAPVNVSDMSDDELLQAARM